MRLARHNAPDLTFLPYFSLIWLLVTSLWLGSTSALSEGQTAAPRKETEDLFYHGFDNYMLHAFPEDELRPISCKPLTRDRENPAHVELNDVLGNYSLTLIDSLSTLAILASSPSTEHNKALLLFQDGVRDLITQYGDGSEGPLGEGLRAKGFNVDSKVQVFETAIRGLGGLLSAHLFAVGQLPIRGYEIDKRQSLYAQAWHKPKDCSEGIRWPNGLEYDGQLLRLAYDLGNRLVPAFHTTTGIPYPRVNLRHGVFFYASETEVTETCSAGAGSLVLEFTVLSRLTGDRRFEDLAKRAFWSIWSRRSELHLIGSGIDVETGHWVDGWTGIGAGIDSFFEYAFKSHILLSRDEHPIYDNLSGLVLDPRINFPPLTEEEQSSDAFLAVWDQAHASIERHLYRGPNFNHPHYIQADLWTGAAKGYWMDALSAYYPGLLTLAGHVQEAIETHLLTTALWTRFSGIPERWNMMTGRIEGGLGWWIGRPEFIESTYYLFQATEDPWYFHVGEMVLRDIKRRCWTRCGWAGIQNVVTGEKIDRMESFFLGETAKYLFLLFDPDHPLNKLDDAFVFTTEGHPLLIPRSVSRSRTQRTPESAPVEIETSLCPVKPPAVPFSISSTAARGDVYHAGGLARLHLMPTRDKVDSLLGEYAVDHPSITLSDVTSPSNYTYFPWTLPPELVPFNAMSDLLPTRPTLEIQLPAMPNVGQPPHLQRVKGGILIHFLGGLKLSMIRDVPLSGDLPSTISDDSYRIEALNSVLLGRDEKAFLAKDTGSTVLNPTDPNFTRVRDPSMLQLVIDLQPANYNNTAASPTVTIELPDMNLESTDGTVHSMKAAWEALRSQIATLISGSQATLAPFAPPPVLSSLVTGYTEKRIYITAITPTGIGAAPLPDWIEAPSPGTPNYFSTPLLWNKIYVADELCENKLPFSVPRNHQVIIVKRGGCTFSKKLSNIPAVAPSASSLQLVVVVSYSNEAGEDQLIHPYLEQVQHTSSGMLRQYPIPMVMVAGGQQSYEALRGAVGLGVKRRYSVQSQGVPISNLIIV